MRVGFVVLTGLLVLGACNTPRGPAGASPDEAAVLARAKALFAAHDAADLDAVREMLEPTFLRVGAARFYPIEAALNRLRVRKERSFPRYANRTFTLPRVRLFGDTAIFTAITSVELVRAEGAAPTTLERSETHVWTRHDGAWRLANWQEEPAGPSAERASWNETYRESGSIDLEPNQLLVETVHGRTPGKALDVGMGQGRNALFLASQGWDVTGVDLSDEGIRQAEATAKAAGLTLHTEVADIDTWDWGTATYDVVALIYMGASPPVDKVRRALVPGGLVVIEFFRAGANAGANISAFPDGALPALFKDGFKVLRHDEVEAVADWGLRKVPLVRFVAQKL